jgi:spore maturation protein CgeB
MKIAFYGSSLLSSYWNGAATYYRGLLREMARNGHEITFYEPDAYERQSHRDIEPPDWCAVEVYDATPKGLAEAAAKATCADVVVKASGVGYCDNELLTSVLRYARPGQRPAPRAPWRHHDLLGRGRAGDAG